MSETEEANKTAAAKESPANESKTDRKTADTPRRDSKTNQPQDGSPEAESPIEHPTPGISVEDSKIDQLSAGASADESKIDKLFAVNRELGIFLEEQFNSLLSLRKSVESLEGFIQSDPTLKKKYDKFLQNKDESAANDPDIQKTIRLRGTLGRLQRFGTL